MRIDHTTEFVVHELWIDSKTIVCESTDPLVTTMDTGVKIVMESTLPSVVNK